MVCDVAIIDNEKTSIGKKKKKWQSKVNINKDKNGNGLKNIKYVWLWVYQDTLKNQFPLEDARQWIKKKQLVYEREEKESGIFYINYTSG